MIIFIFHRGKMLVFVTFLYTTWKYV